VSSGTLNLAQPTNHCQAIFLKLQPIGMWNFSPSYNMEAVAAEAVKKVGRWANFRKRRCKYAVWCIVGWNTHVWGSVVSPREIVENIRINSCNLVQFDDT